METLRNVIIVFAVSGFWHGAEWTFIAWGLLNGLYFAPLVLARKNRVNLGIVAAGRIVPSIQEAAQIGCTFLMTCVAWIFFRAESLSHAFSYLQSMLKAELFTPPLEYRAYLPWVALLVTIEWWNRDKPHPLMLEDHNVMIRWLVYFVLTVLILCHVNENTQKFIYSDF